MAKSIRAIAGLTCRCSERRPQSFWFLEWSDEDIFRPFDRGLRGRKFGPSIRQKIFRAAAGPDQNFLCPSDESRSSSNIRTAEGAQSSRTIQRVPEPLASAPCSPIEGR